MKIDKIIAREILDSRARPTLAVRIILKNGLSAEAMVPSGASTGKYEAVELRDGDKSRYGGLGVLQAIKNVEQIIAPALKDLNPQHQAELDKIMINLDGTENKAKLGANAILAVSMALARVSALSLNLPLYEYLRQFNKIDPERLSLPLPMFNILNGGCHANWASDIQEYMIIPISAQSMSQAMQMAVEVYQSLKQVLKEKSYNTNLGDEGGFAPNLKNNAEAFELISLAIERSNYNLGQDVVFALDVAASEFWQQDHYYLKKEGKKFNSLSLQEFYNSLLIKYPIYSWEDAFNEDDWAGFSKFTKDTQGKLQIVGDDLFVTNPKRLKEGIKLQSANAILIKPNQIGTLSETIETVELARRHNLKTIISHRSGETEDSFIADLSVALNAGQIKTGAPARSERVAKYNRLLDIERELGTKLAPLAKPF